MGFRSRQRQRADGRWRHGCRLVAIHKALKAMHAGGELTDDQFTEKARELLEMLRTLGVMRWRKLNRECVN